MANHKSAEKRDRQSKARRLRNRMNRSSMKTAIRQVEAALSGGSHEETKDALHYAIPLIYKTASKGTIHKRAASRKVSRLTKKLNALQSPS